MMTKPVVAAIAVIIAVVIVISLWWGGIWGLLLGPVFVAATVAIFLSSGSIGTLTLPPAARLLVWVILLLALVGMVWAGGARRYERSQEKKAAARQAAAAARAAIPPPLHTVHYYLKPEDGEVPDLKPGKNHLSLLPDYEVGCVTAPEGWYLSEGHEGRWNLPDPNPNIKAYADCHVNGIGFRTWEHSNFLPTSYRIVNNTGCPVEVVLFLNRIGDQPRR